MTTLREAAQQALEAMEFWCPAMGHALNKRAEAVVALRAALAEPVQEPEEFDHGIGANRFKVVRGAFWWHVLIGDSPTEHGKFRSRAGAEKMAADLLREFRNGAFVQHEAALAEPVQEPVAWRFQSAVGGWAYGSEPPLGSKYPAYPLYTAPPQRKPLTEEQVDQAYQEIWRDSPDDFGPTAGDWIEAGIRYAERAHGIIEPGVKEDK